MKTFKLVSLQVVNEHDVKDVELVDGLIINKENDPETWIIEAYTNHCYYDYFRWKLEQNCTVNVMATITKPENSPAPFKVNVFSVQKIDDEMNVVMEGSLVKTKDDYAEFLLEKLIDEGLSGEDLLAAFKNKLEAKP